MLAANEDALLCDMMETYGISDTWEEAENITKYARFAAGLRSDSRIQMILNDSKAEPHTILLAGIFDMVNWLRWSKTVDAEHNENRPKSILDRILNGTEETQEVSSDGRVIFESPEAFEQEYERLRQQKIKEKQNE